MAVTPPAPGSAGAAVQLTTLTGWRQFVAAVPSVPDLLHEQEWLSLEDGKRAAHDEERLEHHSRLVVVQTPVIGRIIIQGGNLIGMNRLAHYGRSGLMVSGPARTGKTTAVTQLGKTVEVMHRHRSPGSRDDISRSPFTCPPTTRSASRTASGCPGREHNSSASAAAPTSWPPNARPAASCAAATPRN